MTTRYALTSSPQAVMSALRHENAIDFPPRAVIAPTEPVAIVRLDLRRRREITLVRWGLVPVWVKDLSTLSPMFTARAETAAAKPSFRGPMRHRRCLVPADGWYEWTGKPGRKVPHLVRPAAGGPVGLAGLWEHWLGADGSELETMALLTVPAAGAAAQIAERMPVVIEARDQEAWLDITSGRSGEAEALLGKALAVDLEVAEAPDSVKSRRSQHP